MTLDQIIDAIQSGQDATSLLTPDNVRGLTDAEVQDLAALLVSSGDGAAVSMLNEARAMPEVRTDPLSDFDVDEDGQVSDEELIANRSNPNMSEEDRRAVEQELSLRFEDLSPQTLDLLQQRLGYIPDPKELEEIVRAYEAETGERVTDLNQIVADEAKARLVADLAGDKAREDTGWVASKTYMLGDGTEFTLGLDTLDVAARAFDMDEGQIAAIGEIANMYGMRRADGTGIAWQPLAALIRATGQDFKGETKDTRTELLRRARALRSERVALEEKVDKLPPGSPAEQAMRRQIAVMRAQEQQATLDWRAAAPGVTGSSGRDQNNSPAALVARYQRMLQQYNGNEAMAFLGTVDEGLAARLAEVGKTEDGQVDWADARLVGQYISQAFPGSASTDDLIGDLVALGYGEAAGSGTVAGLLELLRAQAGIGQGGAGRIKMMPDRTAVRQAARDFYNQLLLDEPSEGQLDSFVETVMSQAAGRPDDENFDINARIRAVVEATPGYQELYGNKPGGVSDAEYQGMMRAGQQSMLGNEIAGNQAAKLGMRGGKYQTAVGAAAGTSEAWDNSTFLERLARAANVVSRNT